VLSASFSIQAITILVIGTHYLEKTSIMRDKLEFCRHVPFCAHELSDGAFYREQQTRQLIEQYLLGIEKEFSLLSIGQPFDTIYIWRRDTQTIDPQKP
jgi:hypothetical protein